jgi:hypothetical protein
LKGRTGFHVFTRNRRVEELGLAIDHRFLALLTP